MRAILTGAVLLGLLGGLSAQEPQVLLRFGVYTSDKPSVMYRQFLPFVEAIQDGTGRRIGGDVAVDLVIFKTYDEAIDALVDGKIDFVRFGPASYITAKERNPNIGLLVMENNDGSKRFSGMVVVRADSPIKTLSDLRGRRFAFGDPNSTIGRYLIQDLLARNDVHAAELKGFEYLPRHDVVFKAVEIGDFDAGSLKISTFNKLNKNGQLRVLATFPNVTKPWVCRAGMSPELKSALTDTLLGLGDPEILRELDIDGFFPTSDDEYAIVREGMKNADRFERGPTPQPGGN